MRDEMQVVDGAQGEGGGQILRSAVAVAAARGTALRVERIRARRSNPGLRPQHVTAVRACAAICGADLEGVEVGSRELEFRPNHEPRTGTFDYDIGTAGSATLVAQTIVPPLLETEGSSRATIEGGTHTLHAPIWEYLDRTYLPAVARLGAEVETRLAHPGFYPAGGGRMELSVRASGPSRAPLDWEERGEIDRLDVTSIVADLPGHIARREIETFTAALDAYGFRPHSERVSNARSPGNVLYAEIELEGETTIVSEMGKRGRPAEDVARTLATKVRRYLESSAPVDAHLADQLVVPLALGPGGRYIATECTPHCETQLDLVEALLDVEVSRTAHGDGAVEIEIRT